MNIAQDLQTIAHQEQTLVFPHFDSDRAWQIGSQLREMAVARGAVVAIEVRTFGQPLFLPRSKAPRPTTCVGCNARRVRLSTFAAVRMRSA